MFRKMIKNINWGLLIGLFALSAQADLAYVVNGGSSSVSVIDTSTNSVVDTVSVGSSPIQMVINPAGTRAYVTYGVSVYSDYGSGYSYGDGAVSVIDTSNNSVIATLTLQYNISSSALVVNPTGTRLYILSYKESMNGYYGRVVSGLVSVIDTSSNRVMANIQVPIRNGSLYESTIPCFFIDPSGAHLYVDDSVIDTVTNSIEPGLVAPPCGIYNPAGTRLYASTTAGVSVINTSNNGVIATVGLAYARSLAINPAGTRLYAVSGYSVSVIDTSTNRVTATVGVGSPINITVNRSGSHVYVVNDSGDVSVIDTSNNSVVAMIVVGSHPNKILVNRSGSHVYVVNSGSGDVSVIDTSNNSVIATIVVGTSPNGIAMMGSTTTTDYTVTLNKNGNGSVNGGGNFAAGTTVNLTATPDAGYKFVGWNPAACTSSFAMPAQNLTCTAIFEKITVIVPQTSTQCAPYDIFARPQVFIPCVNIGNTIYQAGLNLFASSPSLRFEVDLNSLVINNLIPTAQCAVFPAPNTLDHLRINCLDIGTDKYWVDLQLIIQPNVVQFDLVNFGSLMSGIYSGTKTYTAGAEQGTTYNISMTLLEASSILNGTYTLKLNNSNFDYNLSGTKEGNTIILTADIPSCAHLFVGTINGNSMSGTMTTENNCNGSGAWSVTK